ncbi:hypothetical protein [Colwellia piezophila]|uniref:hypothetical protein n=1 Tax=Colwellia piezophila TaxID=211668 RepID=UPI00035DB655|nr:hypothetical protein [Colwellia piezophila]
MLKHLSWLALLFSISACTPANEQSSAAEAVKLVPQCIGSQSQCEINTVLANFSVKFSQVQLSDKIKTELPFVIQLSTLPHQGGKNKITKISAHLEGKDMFMGKVPVFFNKKEGSDVYSAQSLLASCHEELMDWRLWVTANIDGKSQSFFVDFTSQRL